MVGGLGGAVHQPGEPGGGEQRGTERQRDVGVGLGGRQEAKAREERAEGEDDVHQQAPAPAHQIGEGAADDQPDDRAAAGDRAVHRERAAALARVR